VDRGLRRLQGLTSERMSNLMAMPRLPWNDELTGDEFDAAYVSLIEQTRSFYELAERAERRLRDAAIAKRRRTNALHERRKLRPVTACRPSRRHRPRARRVRGMRCRARSPGRQDPDREPPELVRGR
jgi:hypothetical protein